jgi:D-lactate dehydrogenase (cytochrome)
MAGIQQERDIPGAIAELQALLGDRLSTMRGVCEEHGRDVAYHNPIAPDAVAFPQNTEETARIAAICSKYRAPIIPYGTGTSLEGHITAPLGGISVDVSRMDQILAVHAEDLDAVVQPGVTRNTLNRYIRDTGLFFPIDPGADASLGGMAATRASGTNAVRYGTMRDNVLALEVVLPSGEIVRTGGRARKSSAGYDLTRLMVGSEGTLGIITEVTLRLHGIPERIVSTSCAFSALEGAVNSVIAILQMGVPIARIELLDDTQIAAVNDYAGLGLPVLPTLWMEFHGSPAAVAEQIQIVEDIARGHGAATFHFSETEEDRTRMWKARHDALWANKNKCPGLSMLPTDVCVPISRLADCILETKADIESTGLFGPILGHVGDGNFHSTIFYDLADPAQRKLAHDLSDRMVKRALAMNGTCTGEHGIGRGKIGYLALEHGAAVDVMRSIKQAIDPLNIMNPQKIFEEPAE